MKIISREMFNDMKKLGFIDRGYDKVYYITGKAKNNSKRKKIYICEDTLKQYLRAIEIKNRNTNNV